MTIRKQAMAVLGILLLTPFSSSASASRYYAADELFGGTKQVSSVKVSANGAVFIGTMSEYAIGGPYEAFHWSWDTGFSPLGFLPGHSYSRAVNISSDGSSVIGYSFSSDWDLEAFKWTADTGLQELGFHGGFSAASSDGLVLAGSFQSGDNCCAARYERQGDIYVPTVLVDPQGVTTCVND